MVRFLGARNCIWGKARVILKKTNEIDEIDEISSIRHEPEDADHRHKSCNVSIMIKEIEESFLKRFVD